MPTPKRPCTANQYKKLQPHVEREGQMSYKLAMGGGGARGWNIHGVNQLQTEPCKLPPDSLSLSVADRIQQLERGRKLGIVKYQLLQRNKGTPTFWSTFCFFFLRKWVQISWAQESLFSGVF